MSEHPGYGSTITFVENTKWLEEIAEDPNIYGLSPEDFIAYLQEALKSGELEEHEAIALIHDFHTHER